MSTIELRCGRVPTLCGSLASGRNPRIGSFLCAGNTFSRMSLIVNGSNLFACASDQLDIAGYKNAVRDVQGLMNYGK